MGRLWTPEVQQTFYIRLFHKRCLRRYSVYQYWRAISVLMNFAGKLRLSAEMHADSKHHQAGDPDLVAKLKKENERLRAELQELKQNADKRQ
jgi:hypothetical protein